MSKNTTLRIAAGALFLAAGAAAQPADVLVEAPAIPATREDAVMHRRIGGAAAGHARGGDATFEFISSEIGIEGQTVKGAPYSAEAITESVQSLSDGNRISRKNSTTLFRDGEGRTRREVSLSTIGPWAASGGATKLIMIHDPVAGVSYTLDEKTKTARKVTGKGVTFAFATTVPDAAPGVRVPPPMGPGFATMELASPVATAEGHNAKTETLGKRNIEGLLAEGTRTTITIPAGEIGNERPIEIVSERWFSPELQTVVMTRHSNPMSGENTYKLMNVRRGEPSKALFDVPADYTIKTEEIPHHRIRTRQEE